MEKSVGAFEAKTHFSALLERAERGEEIVITRRGKAVAKIVPVERTVDPVEVRKTLARLRTEGKKLGIRKFDWNEWKSYRDEGRR
ncbi:MAG TPA: type II toxin-antitoxin system prevent-host-death family antitoxin [Rhizomicrobium sp.]|nr:type II toxin-antitoxin system prevent-host-death family antitoxin [Rhizomicrobium sp.]